jgi:hypothetical protein
MSTMDFTPAKITATGLSKFCSVSRDVYGLFSLSMNTSNPSCNENGYADLVSKNIVTETIVALLPLDATTCAISLLASVGIVFHL